MSPAVEGRSEVDMAFELDRKTEAAGAYPIVLASYLIACQTYESQDEADLVKGFLTYVVGDEGQQAAAETAGSARCPPRSRRRPSVSSRRSRRRAEGRRQT